MAERFWNRIFRPRTLAATILTAGFAAALTVNLPGHLEYDSIVQLLEGRTGLYSNWHPPIMSWLLGVSDAVQPGAALFVTFTTALVFGAMLSLLWLVPRPSWASVAAAAVCTILPQLFLFPAIVWKDILFAGACLCAFVFLAHAAARWEAPRLRFALLAGAVLFTALAVLTRQNGPLILPCGAVALGWIAAQRSNWRDGLVYGAGFVAACALLAIGANAALQLRATSALGASEQIEDLQLYDIAGALKREPRLALPILEQDAPALARLMRAKGARLYTPAAHDPLAEDAAVAAVLVQSRAAVGRQWRALLLQHPGLYLAVRAEDFSWLFFCQHPDRCPVFTVGVDGPEPQMKALGMASRYDDRDNWLDDDYATPLIGTPVFSHPPFAILGLASFVLLLRRRRPADIAMAGLLCAVALYTLSYFVISIACEYRYLYVLDLSAIAAAFYLLSDLRWPFAFTKDPAPSA
jgi:hypothetical protein